MMVNEDRHSPGFVTVKRVILAMILLLFAAVLCLGVWFMQFTSQVASGDKTETAIVIVPKGSSLKEINGILAGSGLVQEDVRFLVLARYLGLAAKLQAGEFALHRGQTAQELLEELTTAKPIQHAVTFGKA